MDYGKSYIFIRRLKFVNKYIGVGSSCWESLGSDTSRLVFLVYPEECQGRMAPCVGLPVTGTGQGID